MAMSTPTPEPRQHALLPNLREPKEAFRDLRNYLAGRFVGATRDETLLDEILKCLFCKLYIEVGLAKPIPSSESPRAKSAEIRSIFEKVKSDFPDVYEQNTKLALDPEAIAVVLQECDFRLLEASSDPIGDAFEVFVGSESRSRSGQFFTPRPICEFLVTAIDPKPGEVIIDPACGAGGFLTTITRHFLASGVPLKTISKLTSTTIFGVDKDEYLVRLAKLHVALLTDGHPHIICGDSISLRNGVVGLQKSFPRDGFDVVVTNPPFGSRIVAASPEVLSTFELARRWKVESSGRWVPTAVIQSQVPPQVLFVERCVGLLREGGRLGIVLPESVLSNRSYRYLVQFLLDNTHIDGVIGMPESLFKTSGKGGTHTKTCLLIAHKKGPQNKRAARIFMAEARWCGHDSRARKIPKNDIPSISEKFNLFRNGQDFQHSGLGFVLKADDLKNCVLSPRYYDPEIEREMESLRVTHDLTLFGDLVEQNILRVSTGDELGKLAYGTGNIPFIRTSDISNWELKADPKQGVDERYFESHRHKQDVRPGDILMVKDGTYLIGTCAIVTEADTRIVYQSHLYKIRVNSNSLGLDSFLLLAILSSPIVQRQIRAKQFTQDIIDSLGERIREIVLPIPKSEARRGEISALVKETINLRIKAKEMANNARLAVQGSC